MLSEKERDFLEQGAAKTKRSGRSDAAAILRKALDEIDQLRSDVAGMEGVVHDAIAETFEGVPFALAGERGWFLALLEQERDRLKREQDRIVKYGFATRQSVADELQGTIEALGRVLEQVKKRGPCREPLPSERLRLENERLREAMVEMVGCRSKRDRGRMAYEAMEERA